jgi:predicted phage terminase large subunit-like protein
MRVCDDHIPLLTDPEDCRMAGWLAGFFDGEGSAVFMKRKNGFDSSVLISFSQTSEKNLNLCEYLEKCLRHFGFDFGCIEKENPNPNKEGTPWQRKRWYYLRGNTLAMYQKLLHIISPNKWRDRIAQGAKGTKFISSKERIVSIEDDGRQVVYGLETTTGNYVVWGIASSNSGQYQQDPVPDGGARFNKADFLHWYDQGHGVTALHRKHGVRELIRHNLLWTFVTVDLAASEDQRADYTVFSTWGVTAKFDLLLLDMRRGRWAEPETVNNAVEIYSQVFYNDSRVVAFVAEDNGLGLPIIQAMMERGIPVLPVHIHRTDKFVRSATASIRVKAGQIFFPDPRTPWWSEPKIGFEQELLLFPAHEHDDMVDTLSLAAEAVYQANICGLTEGESIKTPEQTAAQTMKPKASDSVIQTERKFFGRR